MKFGRVAIAHNQANINISREIVGVSHRRNAFYSPVKGLERCDAATNGHIYAHAPIETGRLINFSLSVAEFAWVTLATNDSYALGALVVAVSLKKVNTVHQLAVLVTPGVTPSMRERLQTIFNVVEEVNVLDSKDAANLALLSRPELGITFTKLHCWRLTQFEKCVFLDADTFVSHSNTSQPFRSQHKNDTFQFSSR